MTPQLTVVPSTPIPDGLRAPTIARADSSADLACQLVAAFRDGLDGTDLRTVVGAQVRAAVKLNELLGTTAVAGS